jgi:hypothetical protein
VPGDSVLWVAPPAAGQDCGPGMGCAADVELAGVEIEAAALAEHPDMHPCPRRARTRTLTRPDWGTRRGRRFDVHPCPCPALMDILVRAGPGPGR